MTPLLSSRILNSMRRTMYGHFTKLTFYRVTPTTPKLELFSLADAWHCWGIGGDKIKIAVARESKLDVSELKQNAFVDVDVNGNIRSYKITELSEQQQLNAGWVLLAEPVTETL